MSDVVRLRDGVEWRQVESEILALDTSTSTFFNANKSGTMLWSVLADGATRTELVDALVTAYGITPEAARRDVDAFLDSLARHGLLR
jgi:hypothetical protein